MDGVSPAKTLWIVVNFIYSRLPSEIVCLKTAKAAQRLAPGPLMSALMTNAMIFVS